MNKNQETEGTKLLKAGGTELGRLLVRTAREGFLVVMEVGWSQEDGHSRRKKRRTTGAGETHGQTKEL